MWPKEYRDYPPDSNMIHYPVQPGHGIIGCEMHELNGWGNEIHIPRRRKKGLIATLLSALFSPFMKKK